MKIATKMPSHWLSAHVLSTLPIFITTNLAAIGIWLINISEHSMPLILGIIAGGLVDLDNNLSGRFKNLIITLIAFAISSAGATLSLEFGWLFVPLAVLSTFILVMLGSIGQRYSTIAFGTLVVSVYASLTYMPETTWYTNTLLILAGALLYGLVAMLVYIVFPNRTVQENLAKSYEALGRYLQAKAAYFDPDDDDVVAKQRALARTNSEVIQAFEQTRVSLFYRLRRHNRQTRTQKMLRYYYTAQDILERASSSHYQYHEFFQQLKNSDLIFRFQRVLELQAMACQKVAVALRYAEHYQHSSRGEKAMQGLFNSLNYHQEQGLKSAYRWQSIAENLRNIESQLCQIEHSQSEQEEGMEQAVKMNNKFASSKSQHLSNRLLAENVSGFRNMWQTIQSHCNLSSQLFRHAIRLSVVVGLCSAIVPIFHLDGKGYWVLLTAIFVCQPNYSATKKRLGQRVIGTILGVLVGMLLREYYLTSTLEAELGLIVITASLYTYFRFRHYSFSTFYITLLVLISLDIIGIGADEGILPRVIDTLVGTSIAWFAVSFIFPDWKYINLKQNLKSTVLASSNYLRHIIAQLQFGYNEQLPYRTARREVHNYISALSSAVSNLDSEPKKYQAISAVAPNLLGINYTLLGYISALGAYRIASPTLNQQVDFSAIFFSHGREVATIIGQMAEGKRSPAKLEANLTAIDSDLAQFEQTHHEKQDELSLVLIQQLRLIVQLLPQLQHLMQENALGELERELEKETEE
ncbi:YccS family putative transporter [Haemophilus parahaemolyticus]